MQTIPTLRHGLIVALAVGIGVLGLGHTATSAADLDEGAPPSERYGTAYDDPRYADIYGRRPPVAPPPYSGQPHAPPYGYARPPYGYAPYGPPGYRPPPYRADRFEEGPRYAGPVPREPIYRDEPHGPYADVPPPYRRDRGYDGPGYGDDRRTAPPAYADRVPRAQGGRTPGCLSKDVIQRGLVADGWRDFHAPEVLNAQEAHIRARQADGRLFLLRVDRCSGDVIAVRRLPERGRDAYSGSVPRAY